MPQNSSKRSNIDGGNGHCFDIVELIFCIQDLLVFYHHLSWIYHLIAYISLSKTEENQINLATLNICALGEKKKKKKPYLN